MLRSLSTIKLTFLLTLFLVITSAPCLAQKWTQSQKKTPVHRYRGGYYGYDVAVYDAFMITGEVRGADSSTNPSLLSGAAYILKKDSNGFWMQIQKLLPWDSGHLDSYGQQVAIHGNIAVVGSWFHDYDSAGGAYKSNAGAVYIYEKDSTGRWQGIQKLVHNDRIESDLFGSDVAISGNTIVVGAYYQDFDDQGKDSIREAGAAYVFERMNNGFWKQTQKLVAPDRAVADDFGLYVSISGTTIAISAYHEDQDENEQNTMSNAGSVYIYEKCGTGNWVFVKKVVAPDRAPDDAFGSSVWLSGRYMIIGAMSEDEDASGANTLSEAGSAYLLERDKNGSWNHNQKIVASDRTTGALFGNDACISGNYLVISAHHDSYDSSGANFKTWSGSAYIFKRDASGVWQEVQKIVSNDRGRIEIFGNAVSMYNSTIIVGAPYEDRDSAQNDSLQDAGAAYIFSTDLCTESYIHLCADACYQYNSPSGKYVWDKDGIYFDTLRNKAGCDSIISIDLTINYTTSSTRFYSSCGPMSSPDGKFYWDSSGKYSDTLVNYKGCDSIRNFNVFIYPITSDTISVNTCDAFISPSGRFVWDSSGRYSDTLKSFRGCDSILVIDLIINRSVADTLNVRSCDTYLSPTGRYAWKKSGLYMDTLISSNGCDSILAIDLRIDSSVHLTLKDTTCFDYLSPSGRHLWDSSGQYLDTLLTRHNCDSIIELDLQIHAPQRDSFDVHACDSFASTGGGKTWTSSGIYNDTIRNQSGCKIYTFNLTINNSFLKQIDTTACNSLLSPSGLFTWRTDGIFYDTLASSAGCDSILEFDLTIDSLKANVIQNDITLIATIENKNYRWLDCENNFLPLPNDTGRVFETTRNGSYAVEISDSFCTDTSECVEVKTHSILTNTFGPGFRVYPNPARNYFVIELGGQFGAVKMSLFTPEGREVDTKYTLKTQRIQYEIQPVTGTYLLHVESESGKKAVVRLIVLQD